MHAPLHTSGVETSLTGVWSPNLDRATALARDFGVPTFRSYEELIGASEAVDFAVPPAVQAEFAIDAAAAGRAVLLEKPLAASLEAAIRLVEAIDAAGVANAVILTKRYHQRTRDFLSSAQELSGVRTVTGRYVHGGFLDSGFVRQAERSGWRATLGALFDLGPHLLDLAETAVGRVVSITATGDPAEAVTMSTEHEGGAVGQFLVSGRIRTADVLTDLDVYANEGHIHYTTRGLELSEAMATLRAEFAAAVRTREPVAVDAHRALAVQRIIDAAARSLAAGRPVEVRPV